MTIATVTGGALLQLGVIAAARKLHHGLLGGVLHAAMAFFDTTPLGRIINRFSKDVDVLDSSLTMKLEHAVMCTMSLLATLVVVSYSTVEFLAAAVPLFIIYVFIQQFYVTTSRQLKRLESVTRSPIYSHFSETLTGVSCIRAFNQADRFVKLSDEKVDMNNRCLYPSNLANRWLAVRLELVGNFIVLMAAVLAVVGRESLSPGIVGLSVSYALNITQTLNWLVRMSCEIETDIVAVERIEEYSKLEPEAEWSVPDQTPPPDWPADGEVRLDKYSVRYRQGMDLVLTQVDVHIHKGEKIGVVGRTGAGKSSLTLALLRVLEAAEGSISIDGLDIAKMGLHDLRSRITIIPQDPVLFSGTVRLNLDPFNQSTDSELWSALELSHLKQWVQGKEHGLEFTVSEGGENMSVGQRQLMCLARALLRKTKILILDEATAAVDLETDALIQTTIRSEFKDCTVITIAHRLNTIMDCDRILVLDSGRVKELASPAELLANKEGHFYSLAKAAGVVAGSSD